MNSNEPAVLICTTIGSSQSFRLTLPPLRTGSYGANFLLHRGRFRSGLGTRAGAFPFSGRLRGTHRVIAQVDRGIPVSIMFHAVFRATPLVHRQWQAVQLVPAGLACLPLPSVANDMPVASDSSPMAINPAILNITDRYRKNPSLLLKP